MARPTDLARREALLDAVIETYAEQGIGSRSLRSVAEAVGTSHRMLLHHFGSREGLRLAVVERVEDQQRKRLHDLLETSPDAGSQLWSELSTQSLRPFERLFFECYARGASGEVPFERMHPASVTSWLAVADEHGLDPALIRLGLAVTRGLLLDLVATNDRRGTTEAFELFARLITTATS